MMLIIIPTSFAADVTDDADDVSVSAEDTIIQSSDDVVIENTSNLVGVSAGHNNDVISQNNNDKNVLRGAYDYESTPSPDSVEYTSGESKIITVTVDSEYLDWIGGSDSMYVYINGASNGIEIDGVTADADSFEFDLKTVSDKLVNGRNTLVFHPDEYTLSEAYISSTNFNPLTVQIGPVAEKFLYVAPTGSDTSGDGSKDKPYATITKAIDVNSANGGGYTVLISEGTYSIAAKFITKDITLKALGNVIIDEKNNKGAISASSSYNINLIGLTFINCKDSSSAISMGSSGSGSLGVYNCTFANNTGTYNIIKSGVRTVINGCTFIGNTAPGSGSANFYGIICAAASGSFELTNNIFLNNILTRGKSIIDNERSATLNAKDNYWGSNDGLSKDSYYGKVDASSWAALVTSINNSDVCVGDKATITTQFKSTADGKTFTDLSGAMPNLTVDATSNLGTLDSKTFTIANNTGNIIYTATKDGKEKVNILYNGEVVSSIDFNVDLNIPGSIYVATTGSDTTGDGSKTNPYATIAKALDANDGTNTIIVSGGNYVLSDYQLRKSVTIIGKDNVVITPAGNNYILNIGTGAKKVNLTRLTFANATKGAIGMSTSGSGTDSRTLDISECNFINNKGTVGVVSLYGATTISKCNFINNTATSATGDFNGIISVRHGASLTISYSNFIGNKNTASSSSAISCIYAAPAKQDGWDEIPQPTVIANNNFWGSNDKPNNKIVSDGITVDNWVVVVPTLKDEVDGTVTAENNHEITLEFKSTTDGKNFTDLADAMPDATFNLDATLGTITPTVTLSNNIGNGTYKSDKEGSEKISIKAADTVTSLTFTVTEDETGRIYVATTGSNTTGDGSKAKPFATIDKAIAKNEELGGNQEIIIYAGTYHSNSAIMIKKGVTITARDGEVVLTTDKYHFYISTNDIVNITFNDLTLINAPMATRGDIEASGSYYKNGILNLNNCKFINNTVDRIVTGSYFSFNINNCSFINNVARSYLISGVAVNINNSIFLNNTCGVNYLVSGSSGTVDNNFWGSNNKPAVSYSIKLNNWIVLVPTMSNDTILSGSTYDVNLKFMLTTDGKTFTDLNTVVSDLTFDLQSALGNTFVPEKVTVSNNEGTFKYQANKDGMEKLSILAGKEVVSLNFEVIDTDPTHIYVATTGSDTTGDGSKINPFRSIAKALTKATNGKCTIFIFDGTYYESALNLTADVNIVGMGDNVVIDANNTNYIFAVTANNVNFNISRLTLANGNANYGGAIQMGTTWTGYDANAYIANVRFINNTATTSGGAIYNVGGKSIYGNNNLTVVNCTFINGKANYAAAIETHSDSTIINSVFRNNTLTGDYGDGAAIRMNGRTTTIEGCVFENNKAPADKATISVQSGSLNVTYSVFLDEGKAISAKSSYYDKVHVDYNFWGTNDKPVSKVDNGITINNWIIVDSKLDTADINASEKAPIISEFKLTNDGTSFEALNKTVPGVTISYVPTIGKVSQVNVTMVNNKATTTYTATTEGNETVKVTVNGNVLSELKFAVGKSVEGKIFVSDAIGDDYNGHDGSRLKPYKTIDRAISQAKTGNTIYVYSGVYTFTSYSLISKDLTIIGLGDVIINRTASSYGPYVFSISGRITVNLINLTFANVKYTASSSYSSVPGVIYVSGYSSYNIPNINITDCNFINNYAPTGIVYGSYLNLNLTRCNFINNTATGTNTYNQALIFIDNGGSLYMNYCNFADNTIKGKYLIYFGSTSVKSNVDYNYWGSNDNPNTKLYRTKANNWVVLDSSINSTDIYTGDINDVNLKFELTTDGENFTDLAGVMPDLTVNVVPTIGVIDPQTVTISNNIGKTTYKANVNGTETINVTVGESTLDQLTFNVTKTIPKVASNITISVDDIKVGEDAVIVASVTSGATGNVTFTIGDMIETVEIKDGKATLTVKDLASGDYTVDATYNGDAKYLSSSNSTSFKVSKVDSTISIDVGDIKVGEDAIINVVVPNDATGNVTFTIGDMIKVVDVVDGKAILTVKDLASGDYTVDATYNGDVKYLTSSNSSSFKVSKVESKVDISVDNIEIGKDAVVTVSVTSGATGNVTVVINGKSQVVELKDSKATVTIENLTADDYKIEATYNGDAKYLTSSAVYTFNVNKLPSSITVSVDDIKVGEDAVIVASVTSGATGNVTFTIGDMIKVVDVVDGKAILTVKDLASGDYTVDATYNGDVKYLSSSNSSSFKVSKVDSTISIDVGDIKVGEDAIINVVVPNDATGNVIITIGDKTETVEIKDGKATLTVKDLLADTYTIHATYNGDNKYNKANATGSITVSKVSEFDFNVDVKVDENVTVNVVLPKDATGEITVKVNNNNYTAKVENGSAKVIISDLKSGKYNITTSYSGDDKYITKESNTTIEIAKYNAPINVTYNGNINVGDNETIKVVLPDDATGTVTIIVNGKNQTVNVNKGIADIVLSDLVADKYAVAVKYNGDANYLANETSFNFTVSKVAKYDMNITTTVDGNNVIVDVVLPKDANGNVTVGVDGKNQTVGVVNGIASVKLTNLTTGNHTITVSYNDDKYDVKSVSANVTVVDKSVVLTVPNVVKYYMGNESLVANLVDAEGNPVVGVNVTFTINGKNYTKVTDKYGNASMGIKLVPGFYNVTTTYGNMSVVSNITVMSTIVGDNLVKMFQNDTHFFAKFLDSNGNPLANTTVRFNINGVFYNATTNASGVAKLGIKLYAKEYILTAYNPVTGEEKGFNVTVKPLITQNHDLVKYYRNASQFSVKVYNKDGSLANGTNVTFNINGVFYHKQIINGTATLNINLRPGKYVITSMYEGYAVGNNITVLPTLITKDLDMKYLDGSNFTAQTLDGQGKPLANQNISFNVHGVFYHRTTDENGIASLNMRLNPGKYIITSIWNEYQVGNNITIA
ncbi:beta strand repeat-containing protein [Methanobrevibacter intestini]|uniref:beta strand repeat-containing protein n=1 Tax=Methanobrevibacter intestini TaxID=2911853 RepID=UPI003D05C766